MNMQNVLLNICLVSVLLMGCASVPDTPTSNDESRQGFGSVQVRGTPDHFLICKHCPSVTPKTVYHKKVPQPITRPIKKVYSVPAKMVTHFDHASSDLKADDKTALTHLAKALPEGYRLTITGYTDSTGHPGTNKKLARQRAMSVMNYLNKLGIDKNKFTLNASSLCCYLASNTTESDRAKNRRAEIIVSTLTNEGIQP